MKRGKKGLSSVIATVLLILITFLAIGLIVSFIIPMVKKNLGKSISCFELIEYFKIVEGEYSCYTSENTMLMVDRGAEEYDVKGFAVSIITEGQSKRYDVAGGSIENVKMLNGSETIEVPKPGEARSYVFGIGKGKGARISTIQKDDSICEPEFYNIPACL